MYCDFSFQRVSITMVNENRLLEEDDLDSESLDGLGSQSEFFTPGGREEDLRRAFIRDYQDSDSESDESDDDGQGGQGSARDEQDSQGGQPDQPDPQDNPDMRP